MGLWKQSLEHLLKSRESFLLSYITLCWLLYSMWLLLIGLIQLNIIPYTQSPPLLLMNRGAYLTHLSLLSALSSRLMFTVTRVTGLTIILMCSNHVFLSGKIRGGGYGTIRGRGGCLRLLMTHSSSPSRAHPSLSPLPIPQTRSLVSIVLIDYNDL